MSDAEGRTRTGVTPDNHRASSRERTRSADGSHLHRSSDRQELHLHPRAPEARARLLSYDQRCVCTLHAYRHGKSRALGLGITQRLYCHTAAREHRAKHTDNGSNVAASVLEAELVTRRSMQSDLDRAVPPRGLAPQTASFAASRPNLERWQKWSQWRESNPAFVRA